MPRARLRPHTDGIASHRRPSPGSGRDPGRPACPSAYPPSVGGVEELTRHLALALRAAGDEVEVWTGLPDDHDDESVEVRDGLVVRRFPMPLPASSVTAVTHATTAGWRTMRSLRRAVALFRPDVLHVQCFGPNGAYATALSRLCRVPLVVTLQGETLMDDADIFDVSQVLRSALRAGLRTASAVTACSAFTLDDAVGPVRAASRSGPGDLQRGVARSGWRTALPPELPAPLDRWCRTSWPSGGSSTRRASTS